MSDDKIIIDSYEVENVIRKTFGRRFTRDFSLQISDERYYCPSLTDVKKLIKKNIDDRLVYTDDVFDCDDYSLSLKYYFIKDGYKNRERRPPHCMGMIWGGKLLGNIPHAINFVITDKLKLYLIEPQKDEILKPKKSDREINFIYV